MEGGWVWERDGLSRGLGWRWVGERDWSNQWCI